MPKSAPDVPCMKAKPHPKRAAELTPRGRTMRKQSPSTTSTSRKARTRGSPTLHIEVKRKITPRKNAKRQLATGRKPAAAGIGFTGTYILGAVVLLHVVLLIGALIVIVLDKPQAAEAWKLVATIFPATITSLFGFLAGRYVPAKRT